jgi:hypothetical protein
LGNSKAPTTRWCGATRIHLVLASAVLLCFSLLARGASSLPTGFGAINVGTPWVEIESRNDFEDLSDTSTVMARLSQQCGYKNVLVTTGTGELLVTVNDFIVTELSYATPLGRDSDLMAVADLAMQTYGQPKAATMRDAVGKATLDRNRAGVSAPAKTPVRRSTPARLHR